MRMVVTGGAGFIGSHVVEALLERGDEVHVVDTLVSGKRENVPVEATLHELDIRDEALVALVAELGAEGIVHLAAQADVRVSVARPQLDAEVNVLGTLRVLEAAQGVGAKIVFASTGGAIYGECDAPATEESPRRPLAPYGTSKLCGEEYLATYNRLYGSTHAALRFANVYGPRQNPHGEAGVVAIFFGLLAEGKQCKVFGTGGQQRDYVYVGDVARATLAAFGLDGGVLNIGTGRATSDLELYRACCAAAGVEAEPLFAPARLGDLQRSVLDITLAGELLGWAPERSLEQGLADTWASFAP
ncbi:MAG: UDP-glucose 4-epimerase [Gaiellaceae bacterium]|nr:UDP-glucose 4-epimerase [Gaiellaceae bacterium]